MQIEFSQVVQGETGRLGLEMTAQQIHDLLEREYLQASEPYSLIRHRLQEENGTSAVDVEVQEEGRNHHWRGTGKRSEEHTSELQSRPHLVCRLLLEKKKTNEGDYRHHVA